MYLKVSFGTGDFSVDVHVLEYNQYQCKISPSDYSQIFLIGIYSGREFGWFWKSLWTSVSMANKKKTFFFLMGHNYEFDLTPNIKGEIWYQTTKTTDTLKLWKLL